ncbi:hypothetical protein JAAARDRAFT_547771 [Jaapia argillacea MUCL 33604]|uniref:Uncharacterized protein n=1 Tax=Jaapia argillacea MUCL 33604 TaxID=933084 RepID=A0A067PK07_9AGAM|nr:hypothetical protein JAAARDRAFT_547771 [Jaapia argillacea MUCL 33604]
MGLPSHVLRTGPQPDLTGCLPRPRINCLLVRPRSSVIPRVSQRPLPFSSCSSSRASLPWIFSPPSPISCHPPLPLSRKHSHPSMRITKSNKHIHSSLARLHEVEFVLAGGDWLILSTTSDAKLRVHDTGVPVTPYHHLRNMVDLRYALPSFDHHVA